MMYAIYEGFFNDVEKKLNRVAKKCIKHGNEFRFSKVGEEIRECYDKEIGITFSYKFILIDVEGTAKIDNWECVAVVDVHNSGNIIRRINNDMEVPSRFRTTENICEHCNSKRQRKSLFIIHNTKTDEWKQVGGTCLKLYTGGLSMEYVASYMDGITELEENDGVVVGFGKPYYKVEEILSYAVEVINKTGYFNASSNLPTKNIVRYLMSCRLDMAIRGINDMLKENHFPISFSQNDFELEETKDTVEKIMEYYSNLEDDTEFIHNIKVMFSEGYVELKNVGCLAYLPHGYKKYIQKETEKAKRIETEKSEHFGEIGIRYKDMNVLYTNCLACWDNGFNGITYIHKIVLEDGTVLIWKTGNSITHYDNEVVDKITFTVKGHNEYKGQKQTEITRCKISTRKNN